MASLAFQNVQCLLIKLRRYIWLLFLTHEPGHGSQRLGTIPASRSQLLPNRHGLPIILLGLGQVALALNYVTQLFKIRRNIQTSRSYSFQDRQGLAIILLRLDRTVVREEFT